MTIAKNFSLLEVIVKVPMVYLIYFAFGIVDILFKREVVRGLSRYMAVVWTLGYIPYLIPKRLAKKTVIKNKRDDVKPMSLLKERNMVNILKTYIISK